MKIKDWKKFQHFKDRRPPWIKLYRDILDDPDWHNLSGENAKILTMLWLIASDDEKKEGNLPAIDKLAFRLRITENKLSSVIQELNGWLIMDDIVLISPGYQDDTPEGETETETETEVYRSIFDHWNSLKIISHREIKKFLPFIKARLENYSKKDITDAMDNYSKIVKGKEYFWTHRWTLEDFLSRKKALDQFLTENDPFSNYLKDKKDIGEVVPDDHPKRDRILLLIRIISKKSNNGEQDKFALEHNDVSYDAMRQRASDEKNRLIRD